MERGIFNDVSNMEIRFGIGHFHPKKFKYISISQTYIRILNLVAISIYSKK